MCITTQISPSSPTSVVDVKNDNHNISSPVSCPRGCCNAPISNGRTRRVQFQEKAEVHDTIHRSDLSPDEISSLWLSEDDWNEMKREFYIAKRKKCPTVEMSQPHRVSDRRATVRYTRMVVMREEAKFMKSFNQWKEASATTPSSPSLATKVPPCWNCHQERLARKYGEATKKSRNEAYQAGRRYDAEVRGQEAASSGQTQALAEPEESPTNKRKFLPAIPAC